MDQRISILNVRIPKEALDWIDSLIVKGIYSTRSEAIRDFIRDYLHGR